MKIAILTFSKSKNYGANLQCYALTKFLQQQGHFVEQIDIQRPRPRMSIISKILRLHENIIFPMFRRKYIDVFTKKYKTPEQLKKDPPQSDAFIVGSDQVWNPSLTKSLDPLIYFLSFVPSEKRKIAYAASFGTEKWTDEIIQPKVKELLGSFHRIGVREFEGKEICKNTFGVESEIVLDPTFLIDSYDNICGEYNEDKLTNELVYFTFKSDGEVADVVLNISKALKAKPVLLGGVRGKKGFKMRRFVSVPRWLRSIRYAKYVITDSFHCTVFCVLFRKQFLVTPAIEERNGRLFCLLETLGINDRFCKIDDLKQYGITLMNTMIDYDGVEEAKEKLRKRSIDFLKNALK